MGRYNEFVCRATCPECGSPGEMAFQADLGLVEWSRFLPGEDVREAAAGGRPVLVRPTQEALQLDRLWASGLAACPACGAEVWGKVILMQGVFRRVDVAAALAPGAHEWGELANGDEA